MEEKKIRLGIIGIGNMGSGHACRVVDGREGINGLMLSNAMHMSAFLGKEVTLPIDEDAFYEELKKRIVTSRYRKEDPAKAVVVDLSNTYGGSH